VPIAIPVIWMAKDVVVLTESRPLNEAIYWLVNPMHIWFGCILSIEIGLGTLIGRMILIKNWKDIKKTFTIGPLTAICACMVIALSIFTWGGGEIMFSLYLTGFRFLYGFPLNGVW